MSFKEKLQNVCKWAETGINKSSMLYSDEQDKEIKHVRKFEKVFEKVLVLQEKILKEFTEETLNVKKSAIIKLDKLKIERIGRCYHCGHGRRLIIMDSTGFDGDVSKCWSCYNKDEVGEE